MSISSRKYVGEACVAHDSQNDYGQPEQESDDIHFRNGYQQIENDARGRKPEEVPFRHERFSLSGRERYGRLRVPVEPLVVDHTDDPTDKNAGRKVRAQENITRDAQQKPYACGNSLDALLYRIFTCCWGHRIFLR